LDYGYEEEFYKENIQKIRNDSFNNFILLFKNEINNKDYGIENYLISHFENSNYKLQRIFKSKEYIINENIKNTRDIVKLISKVHLPYKVYRNIEKDIKVK